LARDATNIGSNFGLDAAWGLSPEQARASAAKWTNTSAGQTLAMQLMQSNKGRRIYGGDPSELHRQLFTDRYAMNMQPGSYFQPMNATQVQDTADMASIQHLSLSNAIRGRDGLPSSRQHFNFTQGFTDEALGEMGFRLAQGGAALPSGARFRDMPGADVMSGSGRAAAMGRVADMRTGEIGKTAEAMKALGDLMGIMSDEYPKIAEAMDAVAKGWERMPDKSRLANTFRQMNKAATMYGMSGSQYVSTGVELGRTVAAASGIDADARRVGFSAGYYDTPDAVDAMASRVGAIAQVNNIRPELAAAIYGQKLAVGENSASGKDTAHMAWLRSQGTISADQWREVSTYATAPWQQRKAINDRIFADVYGSADAGRAVSNMPEMRKVFKAQTHGALAQEASDAMIAGQNSDVLRGARDDIEQTLSSDIRNRMAEAGQYGALGYHG
jgi:hypothetical protein